MKKLSSSADDEDNDDNQDHDGGPSDSDLVIRDGFPALFVATQQHQQQPKADGDGDAVNDDDSSPTADNNNKKKKMKIRHMLTGDEPIPRYPFWTCEDAIDFHPSYLGSLRQDCEVVFTARDKPDGAAYSAGQTFFLPANMKPRCALEAIAMTIFQKHTEHLPEGTFNPAQSGANWWTLVLNEEDEHGDGNGGVVGKKKERNGKGGTDDEKVDVNNGDDDDDDDDDEQGGSGEDEVGLHFDADYDLEEQTTNILLHPRVATVTYLSDHGAPTLILEQKSPPMDDVGRKTLDGGIKKGWLSHPHVGKHTAFDGRLLHGAPALYFPSRKSPSDVDPDLGNNAGCSGPDERDSDEPSTKRQKVMPPTGDDVSKDRSKKRYTLLVNVWLNHWVMDAGLLDDDICASLKTPFEVDGSNLKGDDEYVAPFSWRSNVDLARPSKDMEEIQKTKLSPSTVNPAGEDEISLCNHYVTVKYNPTMVECHVASNLGPSVELDLEDAAISLHVGDVLPDDDDREEA